MISLIDTAGSPCGEADRSPRGSLTDTDFVLDGTTYNIDSIRGTSNLHLEFDTAMPETDWDGLTLHIGSATFPLSEARNKTNGAGNDIDGTTRSYRGRGPVLVAQRQRKPAGHRDRHGGVRAAGLQRRRRRGRPGGGRDAQVGQTLAAIIAHHRRRRRPAAHLPRRLRVPVGAGGRRRHHDGRGLQPEHHVPAAQTSATR